MAITKSIPQDNIPKDIVKDVNLLFPQKITQKQIQKVKELISKGTSCFEAVAKSDISFPFKPDLLLQMIVYTNFIEKEPNISSAIILFSFLTWCIDHHHNNASDYLSVVFEVLKTLAINCKSQSNIKNAAISSIYNLLIMIIPKKLENIDFSAKIDILEGIIISVPNLPPYFFDIFVKASYALDDLGATTSIIRLFIELIAKVLKIYPDRFPKKVFNILAPIIAKQIISYNKRAIEIVSIISKIYEFESVQQFLPALLLLLSEKIKNNSILPKSDQFNADKNYITLPDMTNDQIQNNFLIKHETDLVGHVDFNRMQVQLSKPEKLLNIISPKLKALLNLYLIAFKGRDKLVSELVNLGVHLFNEGEFNNSYDAASFFIVLLSELYDSCKFTIPTQFIFNEIIFSPSFTVFNQDKNWDILNSLREVVIEFLARSENEILFSFISGTAKYPYLFTELMYRFSNYTDLIDINQNLISSYCSLLLGTNNYYQSLTELTNEQINIIKEARFSIFYVFNKLIQNESLIDLLFSNEKFMTYYSQLVFEDSLLPLIFASFSNFSKRTLITEDSIFNICINSVLKEASKNFNNEVVISKCYNFLNTANDFILNDDNLLQMFERAIPSLCTCLTFLQNSQLSDSFLLCSINFLTLESKIHHLKSIEASALESAIIQISNENPPPKIFNSLIQLAAGSNAATPDSLFEIEQPKAFRVLLHVFANSPILINVITTMNHLCKSDNSSIKKIHEEGIDIDLLEIIQDYRDKEPDEQKRKIVESILSLFKIIAIYASSVIAVEKFISLFCLVNGHDLPWFHPQTIDTFITLIMAKSGEDSALIPFNHSSRFQVMNIKNEMLLHGFTFCCWIFSNMSLFDYSEHLISIYDKKGQEISIIHTWSSILIATGNQKPIEVDFILNSHEWTLVSVSFKIKDNEHFDISIYNNDLLVKEVTTPFIRFERSIHPLNCQLGGITKDSADVENPSMTSQFALYPYLDHNQIKAVKQIGNKESEAEFNPLFVFIPDKPSDVTVIRNIVTNSPIVSLTEVTSLSPTSFADIFVKRCGVDLILPIFAQWGMTFKNEDEMIDLPEKSVIILNESLLRNEVAQRSFDEAHGVEIVSFLIQSAKKKSINFALYKSLYNLFIKISDKQLKEHFFADILTNIGIWIKTEGEDHLKIIRNWKQNLFPFCMDIAIKERPFKWLLNVMRIYYYYTKCEPEIQMERPDNLDISEIRNLFIVLCVNSACESFNSSDLCYLICTITGCPDSSQQLEYFRIFNELILKGNLSPIRKASDSYAYIKILQYLANSKNKEISIVSIQTLINAYRSSFFTSSCDNMIDIILHEISKDMISKEYFQNLFNAITKDTPELFPIMAWMAMNLGEESINKMYDEVTPSEKFIQGCAWCVWSIITMFKFSTTIARKIASFLIRCSIMNFEQVYSFIDVVGMVMKRSTDDMKSILLDELNKCIQSEGATDKQYQIYLTYCRHFLFFRAIPNDKDKLDKLDKLIKDSPFADQLPVIPQVRQFQELINILRTRPKFNSDGSERYSPDLSQRALQIIAPRMNDEEVINLQNAAKQKEMLRSQGNDDKSAFPRSSIRPNVNFTSPISTPPTAGQRRNLLRRNSVYSITKPEAHSNGPKSQRQLRIAPTPSKGRRGAKAIISSQMNYLLGNDSLAIYSELFFNPIHYIFGIRQGSFSNQESKDFMINWLDKDTAIEFIRIFCEKQFPEFESTAVLIAAFLIFQEPDIALKALSKINVDRQQYTGSLSFFDRNSVRSNKMPMFSQTLNVDASPKANTFLNNFTTQNDEKINLGWKRIIDQIKEYEDKNSLASNETFSLLTSSLVSITTDAIADFCDNLSQEKTKWNKYWQQLWHCISIERAPWNKSLPPNMIQLSHYRRDLSLCYAGFSPKLKNNYKFDIHLEASLVRDTGDEQTGKSKTEELKEQLKNMYAQGSEVYSLFEISDQQSMKEKSNNTFTATKYIIELPCELIKVNKTYEEASFLLLEDSIVLTVLDKKSTVIDLNTVKCIFPRTRCHHMTAIEIFTNDGISYFVNFPNFSSAQILKSFRDKAKIQPCDFKQSLLQSKMTEKWQHREISNFQYLMALNLHSGRSMNDLSQYPVFPWIISDYVSDELDLNDPSVYRDLSKPIGAVNTERLNELKEKSEQLEAMEITPYLYSSCFSCPFIVCLFLIRLEPYTSLHIDIQGGHFDVPSRIFSSINEAFKLCNTNHNDYRELIPEFFLTSEFLVNRDNFDLGVSSNQKIDDVVLPKWAHDNPLEFIYKNRKALESEHVSRNLNNWIDLIWGDKQRGEKAWKADNVYLREMYADIWDVTPLDDVNQRANVEAILTHVGQIPPMLFDKPHPLIDPLPPNNISPIYEELKMPLMCDVMSIGLQQVDKTILVFVVDTSYKFYSFTYDPLNLPQKTQQQQQQQQTRARTTSFLSKSQSDSQDSNLELDSSLKKRTSSFAHKSNIPLSMDSIRTTDPSFTRGSHRSLRSIIPKPNSYDAKQFSSDCEDESMNSSGGSRKMSVSESSSFSETSCFNSMTNSSFSSIIATKQKKKSNRHKCSFNENGAFFFTEEKIHDVFKASKTSESSKPIYKQRSEIKTIASNQKWTAVADGDSVISIYFDDALKFTIPLFSSSVKCLSISSLYHLLVCGTKDGFLLFCSLNSGTIIKTVNLNGMKPMKILITPSWAFVAVFIVEVEEGKINNYIKLFTVNGDLVASKKVESAVQSWKAFNTYHGFDYIVMANANNDCFLFEAFYLNIEKPFYTSDKPVSAVSYVTNCNCVVLASDSGHLTFVTAILPE